MSANSLTLSTGKGDKVIGLRSPTFIPFSRALSTADLAIRLLIPNETKTISNLINKKIIDMKQKIKLNINRMHQNKDKSRNDFQGESKKITNENSEILKNYQEEINKIITIYQWNK